MLKKYLKENCINKAAFARKIGITSLALNNILNYKSSKITVKTAMAIKVETDLDAWDYLDGLDTLKSLSEKKEKR